MSPFIAKLSKVVFFIQVILSIIMLGGERMHNDSLYKRVFTPLILLVISYEWIISGLDKILSGQFVQHMHHELIAQSKDLQYSFYSTFLNQVVIPHSHIFALVIESGELLVGLAFVIISIALFFNSMTRSLMTLGIWTSIIAAFMVLNFFFYQGGSLFLNTGDPFDEGIPIDFILFLIQLFIAIFFYSLRKSRVYSIGYRRF